jgi:hypothetical protein
LQLKPVSFCASKYTQNPAGKKQNASGDVHNERYENESDNTYRSRKDASARIFKYIMTADKERLEDMKLDVEPHLQEYYRARLNDNTLNKLDDLGDSFLHAIHDILCSSSNYKQATPKVVSLYENRTVVISLLANAVYWVVLSCTWNSCICEGLGAEMLSFHNEHNYYLADKFTNKIVEYVTNTQDPCSMQLRTALTNMHGDAVFLPTSSIKVVIKQQTAFEKQKQGCKQEQSLRLKAGALTIATVKAARKICDNVMGKDSELLHQKDKHAGVTYVRSNRNTGQKMQVSQSAGKHLNSVLCFLDDPLDSSPLTVIAT